MKSQIFYDQTGQSAPTKSISKIKIHGSRDSNVFETDDVAPMTEEEVEESLAEHEDAEEEGEEGPYVVEKKRKEDGEKEWKILCYSNECSGQSMTASRH